MQTSKGRTVAVVRAWGRAPTEANAQRLADELEVIAGQIEELAQSVAQINEKVERLLRIDSELPAFQRPQTLGPL